MMLELLFRHLMKCMLFHLLPHQETSVPTEYDESDVSTVVGSVTS